MQLSSELKSTPPNLKTRIREFYEKYRDYGPAAFFFAGFFFDVLTLSRIDDILTIAQQAVYLLLICVFVAYELIEQIRPLAIPRGLQTIWKYRDEIVHFIFGSLLSVYTLFYFKSSSLIASFLFLLALAGLMVANEFSRFQQSGILMRVTLLSVCFISYFAYVIPVIMGQIGLLVFIAALICGTVPMIYLIRFAEKKAPETQPATEGQAAAKGLLGRWRTLPLYKRAKQLIVIVPTVFLALYLLRLIPPVPLSAQYVGVYHTIEKSEGRYKLNFDRPWWAFWQNGAQTFNARPGDRVYVFASIFSPTQFRDQIKMHWFYEDDRQGWVSADRIPLEIVGGRDQGFRGFAFKERYTPGKWRVLIETSDGREISRINLRIVADESSEPREFKTDFY